MSHVCNESPHPLSGSATLACREVTDGGSHRHWDRGATWVASWATDDTTVTWPATG